MATDITELSLARWEPIARAAQRLRAAAGPDRGCAGPADPRVTVELRRQGRPVDLGALIG